MKALLCLSLLVTLVIVCRPHIEIRRSSSHPPRRSLPEVLLETASANGSFGDGDLEALLSHWRLVLRTAHEGEKADCSRQVSQSARLLSEGLITRVGLYEKMMVSADVSSMDSSEEPQAKESQVSFLLVTGERPNVCKSAEGAHALLQSYKNKVEYCSLHGCKVWYMMESWEEGFYGVWARYPALLRLMRSLPSVQWFMWMDADAIFTDFNFSIPFHLYNSWNKNFIAHGFPHLVYGEEGNWFSLNAGIFLIRNCRWSYKFLELWRELGKRERRQEAKRAFNKEIANRPRDLRADDQSALIYILRRLRNETKELVHMEAAYFLHGYYELMVERYEEMMERGRDRMHDDEQWPFTTHFCGCSFCGSQEPVSRRCLLGFTRAYTFAHNQFLRLTKGDLFHPNLNSLELIEVGKPFTNTSYGNHLSLA